MQSEQLSPRSALVPGARPSGPGRLFSNTGRVRGRLRGAQHGPPRSSRSTLVELTRRVSSVSAENAAAMFLQIHFPSPRFGLQPFSCSAGGRRR